jgi:hypothetical protein
MNPQISRRIALALQTNPLPIPDRLRIARQAAHVESFDELPKWIKDLVLAEEASHASEGGVRMRQPRKKSEGLPAETKYMLALASVRTGTERPRQELLKMTMSIKRRGFDEARVRRDRDGQFADVPGRGDDAPSSQSRFATRADDARRSQGQTRSNFVHPVTGAAMGKALDINTPILTAKGWKTMGELWPGDEVHAPDGTLVQVTFVSEVHKRPCYRLFFQDGEELVAADDHRWLVRKASGVERIVTTEWIASLARCNAVSFALPLPLQRHKLELPVDPYVLGAWLGDGSSYKAEMTEGTDPEIAQHISQFYEPSYVYPSENGRVTQRGYLGLYVQLKKLNVLGKGAKHVPEDYLLASEEQRLAILRGLMDTDGSVTIPASDKQVSVVEFSSTVRQLAVDVQALARSLGWKASLREGRTWLNGRECATRWRVTWQATQDRPPFGLARKTARLTRRDEWRGRFVSRRRLRAIEPVGERDAVCIEVDHPSHLFLAGRSLTPTHNTETGDTYEALFEAKGAPLLEARYGGKYQAIAVTGGFQSRNTPLDFKVGDRGGELKSLSSKSLNQKTAIKKEEVERKQKAVAEAGLKPLLVVQVIDQEAGKVQVYAFEEFASKAVKKMEHVGSYDYTLDDFEDAQKKTGHHDKREARAATQGE